jgi:hypothetical protein
MAFANLGELKTVINDTLNRTDLTAQIPNFIKMNEESVNNVMGYFNELKAQKENHTQ